MDAAAAHGQVDPRGDGVMQPLAIDLFCGLGGWTDGLFAEDYRVVGFDIERHRYPLAIPDQQRAVKRPGMNWSDRTLKGSASAFNRSPELDPRGGWAEYPAQLVLQDVLTIHGSQFRNVDLIVASPPCQEFSYMAMPWSRAKQIAKALRGHGEFPEGYTGSRTVAQLTALFDACFRIQREACEAAGRYIPMVVENVKGAQPWVGRAKANYGSFYLWGDVESVGGRVCVPSLRFGALGVKAAGRGQKRNPDGTDHPQGSWFKIADSADRGSGAKNDGGSWFAIGSPGQTETGRNPVHELAGQKVPGFNFHEHEKTGKPGRSFQPAAVGMKGVGSWFGDCQAQKEAAQRGEGTGSMNRHTSSHSKARKAASAQIAKIPEQLSRYIARAYRPRLEATA